MSGRGVSTDPRAETSAAAGRLASAESLLGGLELELELELELDEAGSWKQVKCRRSPLPAAARPTATVLNERWAGEGELNRCDGGGGQIHQ